METNYSDIKPYRSILSILSAIETYEYCRKSMTLKNVQLV